MISSGWAKYCVHVSKSKDAVLHLIRRRIASFKDAGTLPLLILLSYNGSLDSRLARTVGDAELCR
jgi:hypothetical protein